VHVQLCSIWKIRDGVVEEVVEELLAQLLLDIVGEEKRGVVEKIVPEMICSKMALNGVVCGCEEGAAIETVEGGDETGALEEAQQRSVVGVGGEGVDKGG
jgi:hypothetical protein